MPREAGVVVIGAGAFGASVAFHLTKLGASGVTLVDQFELASQTSRRAAGLFAQMRSTELMTNLMKLSVAMVQRFEAETGEPLPYVPNGSLKIARSVEAERVLSDDVERGHDWDLDVQYITPEEACRRQPFLRPEGIRAVTYTPADVYLDPGDVPRGFGRAAAKLGATLLEGTAVTGIRVERGRIAGVETDAGFIATPTVVDAAGGWARRVGALAGVRVPVVPTRHQLIITEPIVGVQPEFPTTRIVDLNLYVRPELGGFMVGVYEPEPRQYADAELRPGFGIERMPLDLGSLRPQLDSATQQFPFLGDFTVRIHRGGLPTLTADGKPLLGPVPGVEGMYVATGCNVGGLSFSPAAGRVLAELILNGRAQYDLSPLYMQRFARQPLTDEVLAAAAKQTYAHHYMAF